MKPIIDAQRWSKIRAVFEELVGLDAAERSERLSTIGSSDPDLRRQVEVLLASDAEVPTNLARIEELFASSSRSEDLELDHDPLKLTGRTVSHFKIGEVIAGGGMGVVYRALDTNLQRSIALKFPLANRLFHHRAKERFLHEARSVAALDHPNVCSIHEVGEMDDGRLFLAMPLYDGETLKARLARVGALAIPEAVSIARQITEGVRAAHHAGIVHRDLKPANVMLLPDGTVKLLDFGLAKVPDVTLTASRALVGTVSYMSPEQIQGQPVDGRADLWAVGVMLYEMLTGRRPFEGDHDVAIAHAIIHAQPPRASTLSPGIGLSLDNLIAALLHKDVAARCASADQLATMLAENAGDVAAHSQHTTVQAPKRWKRRLPVLPAVIVAAILVIVAGLTASLLKKTGAGGDDPPRVVAVLPFGNMSGDTTDNYFGVALSDAIAVELSRLHSLVVPSYLSTANYREPTRPLSKIARELAAAVVVRGSVQRAGDRVRLDIQLVDTANSKKIWTRRYERAADDILDVQREALADLVASLRPDLSDEEQARLKRRPTTSARAYDLYLRARDAELQVLPGISDRERLDAIRLAQSLYSRARDVDPRFAIARARLALTYGLTTRYPNPSDPRLEQARLEAELALGLDPGLPEAHEALAWYWGSGKNDYAKAATELRLAIRGFPNNSNYHLTLADIYRRQGRWEEALPELERAIQIEPRSPVPAAVAATTYSRLRRYQQAVKAWDHALELVPNHARYKIIRANIFLRWHGTLDTLAAVVRGIPHTAATDAMITWQRVQIARLQRRWNDVLTAVNRSRTFAHGDDMFYRPWSLLRAEAYDALGEHQRALPDYEAARALVVDSLTTRPNDDRLRIALGLAYAGLGRKPEAIAEARRAMELVPLTQNNPGATAAIAGAVEVFARAGETNAVLELLELLLSIPAGREVSVPLLRLDPTYDRVRSDPRFEQLLQRFSPQ